ncbi:MAG: ATP-binding protein [Nitrospirae bacterium]|nr:ATP-binding protein [Nitrospirota bacterium]
MIERHFSGRLRTLLKTFPIVCVMGPRQSGKTTFIRAVLPQWKYMDLERPSDYIRLSGDPEDALKRLKEHFILDEAQQIPLLFPVLRSFVDQRRKKNGQLVLLGSASLSLIKQISETLAGRAGFLDITPFHWNEVQGKKKVTLETLWYRGGFPDAFLISSDKKRIDWFDAYTRTFIERDLTALGINISAPQMRKLWTMLAHVNGAVWNASQLASSLGVSFHTINRYTDILEQTFLIRKLPPYFANIGKRVVKSPKVYFRDTGLLHYFLGIHESRSLPVHPAQGASWEGFVIGQVISAFQLVSPGSQAFYWRTAAGAEVDLLIKRGERLIPLEIKLHSSPSRRDVPGLVSCMKDLKLNRGYVLYPGEEEYSIGEGIAVVSTEKLIAQPERLIKL